MLLQLDGVFLKIGAVDAVGPMVVLSDQSGKTGGSIGFTIMLLGGPLNMSYPIPAGGEDAAEKTIAKVKALRERLIGAVNAHISEEEVVFAGHQDRDLSS